MGEIRKNEIHTVTIEGYSSEGLGVARIDGRVVFVHGGIRGELCDILILKVLKNAAYAKVQTVREPSPHRTAPDCPYFGKCGGCAFWHMDYREELEAKREKVLLALQRLGDAQLSDLQILGSERILRYRNKAQFPASAPDQIGFYRARTHEVIPVERCLIQSEAAERIAAAVRGWLAECAVPAYDENTGRGWLRHLYVRTAQNNDALVCLVAASAKVPAQAELIAAVRAAWPQTVGIVLNLNRKPGNGILGERYRTLWGQDYLMDTLCGKTFKLSVPSFYQVNRTQAERLYETALDFAGLTGRETVLELYCGTGTITLILAGRAKRVIGAEIVPAAVEDARENALRNGVDNAAFYCADAAQIAEKCAAEGLAPDVVVVDPPRKGLAGEVIEAIAAMAPARLVYVSCDPATLGRDVKLFAGKGYNLRKAAAVDMFPRTSHVETVCLLSKLQSKEHIEIEVAMDELDLTSAESKATYEEIREYVLEHTGLKVSHLYIAQVKQKYGIIERENYNKPKSENAKQPQCPPEKEKAITEALRHFGMIKTELTAHLR